MVTKKKNRLLHWLWWLCSDEYRQLIADEAGDELWQRLSQGLPKPVGITEKDENRVKEFAARFKTQLTREEQTLLVEWLQDHLYYVEFDLRNGDMCPSIIKSERTHATIYRQHLMAVS